jgi:predicted Fe-Mo cluster-binding NifX family protein
MRIAVAADGMDPNSAGLAPTLGLARHILILDQAGNVFDSIDREPDPRAAGTAFEASASLKEKDVDLLLTWDCGPSIEENLKSSGIDVRIVRADSVRKALEDFKRGELAPRGYGPSEGIREPKIPEDSQRREDNRISSQRTEAQRIAQALEIQARANEAKVAKKNEHLAKVLDKYVKADGQLLARYEQFASHPQPVNMALLLALVEFLVPKVQFRDVMGDILKDIEDLEKDTQEVEARAGEAKAKAQEAFAKAKRAEEKAEEAEALVDATE